MKTVGVVAAIAALIAGLVAAGPARADEGPAAKPLEVLGAGLTYVQPFDGDHEAFAALDVTFKLLPVAAPESLTLATAFQYVGANVGVDVLISQNDVFLGVSAPVYRIDTDLPVRLGVAWARDSWNWFVTADVLTAEF